MTKFRNIDYLTSSYNYFSYLPDDIILKIFKIYDNMDLYKSKWCILYLKLNTSIYKIIDRLHKYHGFATKLCQYGHLCYHYNYNIIGSKYIEVSSNLHILFKLLIYNSINLREQRKNLGILI